jgi:hypothetical protein
MSFLAHDAAYFRWIISTRLPVPVNQNASMPSV